MNKELNETVTKSSIRFNKICFVKCENYNELTELSKLGVIGLPYTSDWAPINLLERKTYPVYVRIDKNEKLGIILLNIQEEEPRHKPAFTSIFSLDEFKITKDIPKLIPEDEFYNIR